MSSTVSAKLLLRNEVTPTVHATLEATIDTEGKLVLAGCDSGKAVEETFGDSDYEYWITVPAASREQLLLRLLERSFGASSTASSDFMAWLKSVGIPYEFHSF